MKITIYLTLSIALVLSSCQENIDRKNAQKEVVQNPIESEQVETSAVNESAHQPEKKEQTERLHTKEQTERLHALETTANHHMNSSSFEELVDRFEGEDRADWQKPDKVIQKLGNINGQKIIDIGCGTGYFAFRLAEAGAQVVCADIDDRFLEYVDKKKARLGLSDATLSTAKVSENSPEMNHTIVDKAIMVNTYHHIKNRVEYFKKVSRSLKDEGEVIIIDFMKSRPSEVGPPQSMRVGAQTVVKEMRAAGLDKYEIDSTLLPYQYIITVTEEKDIEFVSPN